MEQKIRIGIVSYLNTRPLIYGLERLPIKNKITLIEAFPAALAEMLQTGQIDLGMVPVAIIPKLQNHYIDSGFCIGAVGNVASVALFSDQPIDTIRKIYLDYQSRSSVQLLKWLIKNKWNIHVELIEAKDESFIHAIKDDVAALIIGDRALQQRIGQRYVYDLAGEWKAATGLPFVFAAWVSTQKISAEFIAEFDKANAYGLEHIDEIAQEYDSGIYDLKKYYSENLSYHLDEGKRKGMELFLKEITTTK